MEGIKKELLPNLLSFWGLSGSGKKVVCNLSERECDRAVFSYWEIIAIFKSL